MDDMNKDAMTRWIVSFLVAALFGLAAVVWTSVSSQISDLRSDTRVLQKDVGDLHVSIQDLKSRLVGLVDTLNAREDQRAERENPHGGRK